MKKKKIFKAAVKIACSIIANKKLFESIVEATNADYDNVNIAIAKTSVDLAKEINKA